MNGRRIGFALCGSFCTFDKAFAAIEALIAGGAEVTPIMSFNAASIDTRFGKADSIKTRLRCLCGKEIIDTIAAAEPVGPKRLFDLLIVAPCTGNTLAKLALGITDTPVAMAVKSHLRNRGRVLVALATNDALAASARNIGELLARRGYFFVPMAQDAPFDKPASVVADFSELPAAARLALDGIQIQPIIK